MIGDDGIAAAIKFQSGKYIATSRGTRFGLSWRPLAIMNRGDLGRGSSETTAYFMTEEGRTYFMQAEAPHLFRAKLKS